MPRIEKILSEHLKYSDEKYFLKYNLGDGYLLKNNLIYRNIRSNVFGRYKFTQKLLRGEQSFKLSFLNDYHRLKRISYNDNVSRLIKINETNNRISLSLQYRMFEKNHLLHESAHAMARMYLLPLTKSKKITSRTKFMMSILEESFGNTVEIFSHYYAKSSVHAYFLAHNSYAERRSHFLRKPEKRLKEDFLKLYFGVIFMSFVYSNYLIEKPKIDTFNESVRLIKKITGYEPKLTKYEKEYLRDGFKIGFTLDPVFRLVTTDIYIKISGYKSSLSSLTSFNFIKSLQSDENLQCRLNELFAATLTESPLRK